MNKQRKGRIFNTHEICSWHTTQMDRTTNVVKTATCTSLCLSFCIRALKSDRFPSSGITDSILRLYLLLYPRKPVLLLPVLKAPWQNEGQH
jgi:hypothetical protein